MYTPKRLGGSVLALALSAGLAWAAEGGGYGLGREATPEEIAGWDIDVAPGSERLPAGSGGVAQGARLYAETCAVCHGANGEGKPMDRLVGGQGSLGTDQPVKTVGSYWPHATTLYDYIYRAMPFDKPQSLTPDQVYAVTAYLLHLNGVLEADATLDAKTLAEVQMPNRAAFVPDPRPDVANIACRVSCK